MISSKFGKFPVNIRVVVAREAYGGLVTGPERRSCSASGVPRKYRALQGHYAIPHTFDRVLRTPPQFTACNLEKEERTCKPSRPEELQLFFTSQLCI